MGTRYKIKLSHDGEKIDKNWSEPFASSDSDSIKIEHNQEVVFVRFIIGCCLGMM